MVASEHHKCLKYNVIYLILNLIVSPKTLIPHHNKNRPNMEIRTTSHIYLVTSDFIPYFVLYIVIPGQLKNNWKNSSTKCTWETYYYQVWFDSLNQFYALFIYWPVVYPDANNFARSCFPHSCNSLFFDNFSSSSDFFTHSFMWLKSLTDSLIVLLICLVTLPRLSTVSINKSGGTAMSAGTSANGIVKTKLAPKLQ